eukprot:PhF_6_TR20511/c0_g1_i4/m.29571/K06966/K06966; uncharacterized protein
MVFILNVNIWLTSPDHIPEFLSHFRPLALHCEQHEPHTLHYKVSLSDKENNRLLISERYRTKEDYLTTHRTSQPFLTFKEWMQGNPIIQNVEGHSYIEVDDVLIPTATTTNPAKYITIYAGFSEGVNPIYVQHATTFAQSMVSHGFGLVYGGGSGGVMGAVAKTVAQQGSSTNAVIGIVPHSMSTEEVSGTFIGRTIVVKGMAERKDLLRTLSEYVVILPGGVGTLDELFETLTLHYLGHTHRKIGILNTNGFYNALLEHWRVSVKEGFIRSGAAEISSNVFECFLVEEDPEVLIDKLIAFEPLRPAPLTW